MPGTPGEIRCGRGVCDAEAEVCCASADRRKGRCLAREGFRACPEDETALSCDETADCGEGAVCCETYECSGGCPMQVRCEPNGCSFDPDGELCVAPGGPCSGERECRGEPGAPYGHCLAKPRAIACGERRCAASCCYDSSTKATSCSDECPQEDVARQLTFNCTSPGDCPGAVCANISPGPVLSCIGRALASGRAGWVLCDTVADCPPHWGDDPTGCKPSEDLIAGMKTCVW